MSPPIRAIFCSDEPLTVFCGERAFRQAGVATEVVGPRALLQRLEGARADLVVVDLDTAVALPVDMPGQVIGAARAWGDCGVVAVSAGEPRSTDRARWPWTSTKPFSPRSVRAWLTARAMPQMGMASESAGRQAGGVVIDTPPGWHPTDNIAACAAINLPQLRHNLGSDEDVLALLADYRDLALPRHGELRAALAAGPLSLVGERAHQLCGSLGAIEARDAAGLCRALMEVARQGDEAEAARRAPAVLAALRSVERALEALVETHPADRRGTGP